MQGTEYVALGQQHTCAVQDSGMDRSNGDGNQVVEGRNENNPNYMDNSDKKVEESDISQSIQSESINLDIDKSNSGVKINNNNINSNPNPSSTAPDPSVDSIPIHTLDIHNNPPNTTPPLPSPPAPSLPVLCWGKNLNGQADVDNFIDNDLIHAQIHSPDQPQPQPPASHFTSIHPPQLKIKVKVHIISAGYNFSCAVLNQHIVCIGCNEYDQLHSPKLGEQVAALSAGASHACALGRQSALKCWGANSQGQAELPILKLIIHKVQLGISHSCVLASTFELVCWGTDVNGQLELIQFIKRKKMPVHDISVMLNNTCVVDQKRVIMCTKDNVRRVQESSENFSRLISTSENQVCQVRTQSIDQPKYQIACQEIEKNNASGLINNQMVPNYKLMDTAVRFASLGESNTCFMQNRKSKIAKCFGRNRKKINNIPNNFIDNIQHISTNFNHSCALLVYDIIASDSTADSEADSNQPNVTPADQIYTPYPNPSSQKIITNATIKCWGENSKGQTEAPELNPELLRNVTGFIKTGLDFACVFLQNNSLDLGRILTCWGDNTHQQLNQPHTSQLSVTYFDLGSHHGCAMLSSEIVCWGANLAGQASARSLHTSNKAHSPSATSEQAVLWLKVNCGFQHNCAITDRMQLVCWGWHTGLGQPLSAAKGLRVMELAVGYNFNCVQTIHRQAKCWGSNEDGQLDVPEVGGKLFMLFAGYQHSCATLQDGQVVCWGKNDKGQSEWEKGQV